MKAGRIEQEWRGEADGLIGRTRWFAAVIALGILAGAPAMAQNAVQTPTLVPTVASNQARTEAERERAIAAARELRLLKENASFRAVTERQIVTRQQVADMNNLERNIKVSAKPRSTANTTAASTSKPPAAPAVVPEKKRERRGLAGLFGGKKDSKKKVEAVSDPAEVKPIAAPPIADTAVNSPPATAERIPPPSLGAEPGSIDPYAGPGEIAAAPGIRTANPGIVSQPPAPNEDRGLFGGLFSRKKSNDAALRSATMASAEKQERKGFLGRLFGRDDGGPNEPAPIPPPAIPPPEIPTEQGSPADPTLLTQNTGGNPYTNPNVNPVSDPAPPQTATLPEISGRTSLVVAPDGTVNNPAAMPSPASVAAPAPPPAPVPTETAAIGGAHFVVVQHESGAQLSDTAGVAMQPLPFGTVMQLRKTSGNRALVRLTSNVEGYVETARLRDANFDEATRFYTSGGSVAE